MAVIAFNIIYTLFLPLFQKTKFSQNKIIFLFLTAISNSIVALATPPKKTKNKGESQVAKTAGRTDNFHSIDSSVCACVVISEW